MSQDFRLNQLVGEIENVVASTVSQSSYEDAEVRRILSFISQVIVVVEQAFQDALTVLVDLQYLDDPLDPQAVDNLRRRIELLTARSHFRDALEICSRLRSLRDNYDAFIRPSVDKLGLHSDWQGIFEMLQEGEGRLIWLVYDTAREANEMLDEAEAGQIDKTRRFAAQRAEALRCMLTELHALNGRILGLSGRAGFLELTRDRNALEQEVSLYVDKRVQTVTNVTGNQYNAGRDINTVQGDLVQGDKIGGDKIGGDKVAGDKNVSVQIVKELQGLLKQVEEAAQKGELDPETAEDAQHALKKAAIEAEKPQPDKSKILDHVDKTKTLLEKAVSITKSVGSLAAAATAAYLKIAGWLV